MLLQNFFSDERVQILVSQILIKQASNQQNQVQVLPASISQELTKLEPTPDNMRMASDLSNKIYNSKFP